MHAEKMKQSITMEKMFIEPRKMNYFTDDGMSNIKRLKVNYGVRILLPAIKGGSEITIIGPAKMIDAAKNDIRERMVYQMGFFIEKNCWTDLVIGHGRAGLQALANAHKVKIAIQDNGLVTVTGSQHGCDACKKAIESLINNKKVDPYYQDMFYVPDYLMGKVSEENMRRIESTYNVNVSLPSSQNRRSEILVTGSAAENVSAAKKDILFDSLPWTLMCTIDEPFIDGKETVKRLEKEFSVDICLENGRAYISGSKDRTLAARDEIISIISGDRKKINAAALL